MDCDKQKHIDFIKTHGEFQMDCSHEIFSDAEITILKKYGHWFKALVDGTLEAISEEQKNFIAAIKGEKKPENLNEKIWFKYLGRKKVEGKYGNNLKVKHFKEENSWYSDEDYKKAHPFRDKME